MIIDNGNIDGNEYTLEILKKSIQRQDEQGQILSTLVSHLEKATNEITKNVIKNVNQENLRHHHEMRNTINAQEALHTARLGTAINHITARPCHARKYAEHLLTALNYTIHNSHGRVINGKHKLYKRFKNMICETFNCDVWTEIPLHLKNAVHSLISSLEECTPEQLKNERYMKLYLDNKVKKLMKQ